MGMGPSLFQTGPTGGGRPALSTQRQQQLEWLSAPGVRISPGAPPTCAGQGQTLGMVQRPHIQACLPHGGAWLRPAPSGNHPSLPDTRPKGLKADLVRVVSLPLGSLAWMGRWAWAGLAQQTGGWPAQPPPHSQGGAQALQGVSKALFHLQHTFWEIWVILPGTHRGSLPLMPSIATALKAPRPPLLSADPPHSLACWGSHPSPFLRTPGQLAGLGQCSTQVGGEGPAWTPGEETAQGRTFRACASFWGRTTRAPEH